MVLIFGMIWINLLVKAKHLTENWLYSICPMLRLLIFGFKIISIVALAWNFSVVFGKRFASMLPFLTPPIPLSENHTDQTLISQSRLGEGGRSKSGCRSWWMIVCECYGYSCIPNTCRRDWEGLVLAKCKCVFSLKLPLFFMKAQQHLVIWVLLA